MVIYKLVALQVETVLKYSKKSESFTHFFVVFAGFGFDSGFHRVQFERTPGGMVIMRSTYGPESTIREIEATRSALEDEMRGRPYRLCLCDRKDCKDCIRRKNDRDHF